MTNIEIISVHIPKTAGTTLRTMMVQFYGNHRVCTHYPNSPEVDGTRTVTEDTKVIHGHFFIREYLERYPEAKTSKIKKIAWVRHPITRLMSHYFYNKKYPFSINQDMNKLSLVEYAKLPWKQNEMSKHLEGVDLQEYYFIGVQEFFNEDLVDLQQQLRWSNIETNLRDNSSLSQEYYQLIKENLSQPKVLDKIVSLNSEDMELYERALKLRAKRRQESSQIYQVQIGWKWAQVQLEYLESKLEKVEENAENNVFLRSINHLDDEAFINKVYWTYLKREPDPEGKEIYGKQIQQGLLTRETFLEIIASSEESIKFKNLRSDNSLDYFLKDNAAIDNESFIELVYLTYLKREPDPEGKNNYLKELDQNLITRRDLVEIIINSEEYRG